MGQMLWEGKYGDMVEYHQNHGESSHGVDVLNALLVCCLYIAH